MTLTQVAIYTKKAILIGCAMLVVVLSGWISFQIWYNQFYLPNKPPEYARPDTKFGVLPKPQFPATKVDSASLTYSVDTETGNLPFGLPPVAPVYFVPQLGTTLLAPNRARELADKLGFKDGPELVSPTLYRFRDGSSGSLEVDINSGNFRYNRELDPQNSKPLFDEERLASEFRGYVENHGLAKGSLKKGRIKVSYNGGSRDESQSATISMWPENINDAPVVTPSFTTGLIKATRNTLGIPLKPFSEFTYIVWEPDLSNYSIYPIKTLQTAYEELQAGQGVVIMENGNRASITNAYLAFYQPQEYTQYIQPIFVFESDTFAAYVPAIANEFYEQPAAPDAAATEAPAQ